MAKVLVTGGTVFVSCCIAEYFVKKGCDVYVLNRNTRTQVEGVTLIEADRHDLGERLRAYAFDAVIDTAYTSADVDCLLDALGEYEEYILISSSAVYPAHTPQPIKEESPLSVNQYWGKYGMDKIEAEQTLQRRNPNAYIVRPPYLYGPMNNVYREAFVFDCAMADRRFCLPKDGGLKLQFFYIDDLCRFIDILITRKPQQHIFNVGNKEAVTVRQWVELCYDLVGKKAEIQHVYEDVEQRNYFSFYDYEYLLDVSGQYALMPDVKPLKEGLRESLKWYLDNPTKVNKKAYIAYIDQNFVNKI